MNGATIAGALAGAGVAVLLALALVNDDSPSLATTDATSELGTAFPAPTSTSSTSTTTVPPTSEPAATTEPVATTEPAATTNETVTPTTDAPTTTARPTTVPTTTPPSTTAPIDPAEVQVQVLNAGANAGSAGAVEDVLRAQGFTVAPSHDAPNRLDRPMILFAPGQQAEATKVNEIVNLPATDVIEVPEGDPNWFAWGEGQDVLVLIGPGYG